MAEPIRQNAKQLTVGYYLQMVGIIQSIVAGFLIFSQIELIPQWSFDSTTMILILQNVAVFQIIVLTWQVNAQQAAAFDRVIGLQDSYIAFLFFIPEFLLIHYSDGNNVSLWLVSFFIYCILVLHAYNYLYKITRGTTENNKVFEDMGRYTFWIRTYFLLGGLVFLGIAFTDLTSVSAKFGAVVGVNIAIAIFAKLHDTFFWRKVTS